MPCSLARVDKKQLLSLLEKDPANGMLFFKRLASTIGQRLVNTYNTLLTGPPEEKSPSYG